MSSINDLRRRESKTDSILDFIEVLVFSVFLMILVFTFLFRIAVVQGPSMENTLFNNDWLIMTHLGYVPENGDIVVINSEKMNQTIIKRVIGVTNDWVRIDVEKAEVSVNGKVLDEDYIKEDYLNGISFNPEDYNEEKGVYEYFVPYGYIFVLGDNRNDSTDSRLIGLVSEDEVAGKAALRIYSEEAKLGRIE